MKTDTAGIWELGLVFGSLLALLIWELYSLRKTQRKDAQRGRQDGPDA